MQFFLYNILYRRTKGRSAVLFDQQRSGRVTAICFYPQLHDVLAAVRIRRRSVWPEVDYDDRDCVLVRRHVRFFVHRFSGAFQLWQTRESICEAYIRIGFNKERPKYRVAQKVSHYEIIKNRIKSYQKLSMRLDFVFILKCE